MKRCDNCFELNSDGATNCVICGEVLEVPQTESVVRSAAEMADDTTPEVLVHAEADKPSSSDLQADYDEHGESDISCASDLQADYDEQGEDGDDSQTDELPPPEPPEVHASEGLPDEQGSPATPAAATPPPSPAADAQIMVEVYHDTEPRVIYRHPVVNDMTLIGREDPQRDVFPDLDLGKLEGSGVSSRHASRQHLRLLRQNGQFFLFVYRGTTGTQINKDLIDESRYGRRFQINVGDRMILGGKVRLKLARQE